jgi:AcrR family transcriptional regulator
MAESTNPDRRQQRAQATSRQLLLAAREVFERKGYRATTVGAITEAASTAHGTFYLYFKNKEEAFAKVFSDVVGEIEEATMVPWQGDARTTIHRATTGYFEVVARHHGLWRCLMEGIYHSRPIEQLWLEQRRPFIDRLEKTLPAGGDTRAVAVTLGSMIEWTAYTVVEMGEPAEIGLERAVAAVVDLWCSAAGRADSLPPRGD